MMLLMKRAPLGAALVLAASMLPACAQSPTKPHSSKAKPAASKARAHKTGASKDARTAQNQRTVLQMQRLQLRTAQLQYHMAALQMARLHAEQAQQERARISRVRAERARANRSRALVAAPLPVAVPLAQTPTQEKKPVPTVLNFTLKSLGGKDVSLSQFQGKTIMIVNTASKCGNTPQYEGLEKMYEKYKARGLVILGFPSNDFAGQEPGTDGEIAAFCHQNYGVSFPMFSKVKVKGEGKTPLYEFLTSEQTNPGFAGEIDWNFAKFLIDPSGKVVARFKSSIKPDTPEVVAAVEKALSPAA